MHLASALKIYVLYLLMSAIISMCAIRMLDLIKQISAYKGYSVPQRGSLRFAEKRVSNNCTKNLNRTCPKSLKSFRGL